MKVLATVLAMVLIASAALAQDQAMATKPADDKLIVIPGLPNCFKGFPVQGDPFKGAATIYAKASAGCNIPSHWHTATENLTWVAGSANLKMKGAADQTMGAGTFVHLPGKHEHALKCTTACTLFVITSAAFDIHYVDANGKEIPVEQALGTARKPTAPAAKKKM